MDDTDRRLVWLLWQNPRIPLQEVSKKLGISRQSVHRRLRLFERMGVFQNMKPRLSGDSINQFAVAVWGQCKSTSVNSRIERLGRSRHTWFVEILGGNCLFVVAGFIDAADLNGYVKFVREAAEMEEPMIGIICYDDGINPFDHIKKQTYKRLSPLDLRIIDSLKENARKPVSEIASQIGVSAKTVRRHLGEMISDGSMAFNQPWDLTSGEDTYTLLCVKLRRDADKVIVARRLLSIDPIHFNFIRSFSNIPDYLVGVIWSERMKVIRKILAGIAEDDDVLTVTPNVIFGEHIYWNQDPMLPDAMSQSSRKARH